MLICEEFVTEANTEVSRVWPSPDPLRVRNSMVWPTWLELAIDLIRINEYYHVDSAQGSTGGVCHVLGLQTRLPR
jgi:hypothetical protein